MNIEKNHDGKELTLIVEGNIDTNTSEVLADEINAEIGKFDSLIIDFSSVEYISSAGLRVLISTKKKLKKDQIPFVIKNVNDAVNEIFKMSGFDRLLDIK